MLLVTVAGVYEVSALSETELLERHKVAATANRAVHSALYKAVIEIIAATSISGGDEFENVSP